MAAKIQNAAEIMYPGVMRPINLRKERFNEHMTKGSLILEVGSNGNTSCTGERGRKRCCKSDWRQCLMQNNRCTDRRFVI